MQALLKNIDNVGLKDEIQPKPYFQKKNLDRSATLRLQRIKEKG